MDKKHEIDTLLRQVEADHDVEILYACESGSRAWGFASPNSDYDIRFLYRAPVEHYLSVFEQKDTIELPICDDLDPGGWDIKKALGLLAKSNGALIEWLHSPIVYHKCDSVLMRWRRLSEEVFHAQHVRNHYLGLARQVRKAKLECGAPTAKGYLYVCRALLAAHAVQCERRAPAVEFTRLVDDYAGRLRPVIRDLVAWKEEADEVAECERIPALEHWIAAELYEQRTEIEGPCAKMVRALIDAEFRRLIERE